MSKGMEYLLEVKNLVKSFGLIKAVNNISFSVPRTKTIGIVGESGSGKTTLARCILRLIEIDSGNIIFDGEDITNLSFRRMLPKRKNLQAIFQETSLNPRMKVYKSISEPLEVHGVGKSETRMKHILEIFSLLYLSEKLLYRYPHELSGGEKQRVCIARALILKPKLVIADEPVSSLDVSVGAEILNLLLELKKILQISFVFISHDLAVVEKISDEVAVMFKGTFVESGAADQVFLNPLHPYTKVILNCIKNQTQSIPINYGQKKCLEPSYGCEFFDRCPNSEPVCFRSKPPVCEFSSHKVRCYKYCTS